MSRRTVGWWAALAAAALFGCSDDDVNAGDGSVNIKDMTLVDKGPPEPDGFALPDGYPPLYSCKTPGQSCNAHDPCALDPVCGPDKKCHPTGLQNCNDKLTCTTDTCAGLGVCKNTAATGTCVLAVLVSSSSGPDAGAVDAGAVEAGTAAEAGAADASVTPDGGGPTTTELRCFKKGDPKPSDPCMACTPDTSQTKWSPVSGGKCDDGNSCTKDDTCVAGTCKGTNFASTCSDGISCTQDICDGKGGCGSAHPLKTGWCLINATCYKDGGKHPSGTCFECDVSKNTADWTAIANTCLIDNKCYKKGDKHTGGCGECDPTVSATKWSVKGTTHCLISDKCVASGAKDSSGCAACAPATDKYAYTPLTGMCKMAVDNKCYTKGDKHSGGCAECDPATSITKWTVSGTTHCLVSNACIASGTKDSTGCAACTPATDKYAYTPLTGKCKISGTCYADGAAHPKGCAKCKAATNATTWTLNASATGCLINHECYAAKATFGCFTCDPTKSKTAWTQISGCTNLETSATATSSGGGLTSTGYGPELMNDGKGQTSCKAHWLSASTSPGGKWIMYTWAQSVVVGQVKFDTQPAGSKPCTFSQGRGLAGGTLQYWKSGAWVTIGKISGKTDDWSYSFTPVTTDKLRLYDAFAVSTSNPVIYEWMVYSK